MNSVIKEPRPGSSVADSLVIHFATRADDITAWGTLPFQRDRELRGFWPTEPMLASAIYGTATKYAAFGWTLKGPPRTVDICTDRLQGVEHGQGWSVLVAKIVIDLLTQDNGAYVEVVRADDTPMSPWITLNSLDSGRCIPTGRVLDPVEYVDSEGQRHLLKWYQVIRLTEFPSPIERMRGFQYCAVTRVLRAAQIMRDISIYRREKVSGRFNRAVHIVGGVQAQQIKDAIALQQAEADNEAMIRYVQPLIVAGIDPSTTVSKETIELASLPDGFDEEQAMKWYIVNLALALGADYQDFAPLPGGGLGSSGQSQVLHLKSRGKGPALFMRMLEHMFNYTGVLPQTTHFSFGDQDIAEDLERATLRLRRGQERSVRIASGEITPEMARQMAVDVGDLDEKYLRMIDEADQTAETIMSSS